MTAGMAFEALCHAGSLPNDLLVVLNDNEMSISENVGALSNYLARVLSGRFYSHLRDRGKKVLAPMPTVWELARRSEEHMKGMVLPGTMFEEMGFNYIGPVDGHDLKALVTTLKNVKQLKGPQFLHVVTRKGKGYAPGRSRPHQMAWTGPLRSAQRHHFQGKEPGPLLLPGVRPVAVRYRRSRSENRRPSPRRCAKAPAWSSIRSAFPDRYFDVAIAEQHAVTLAAGLATAGMKPVVAIYSTFLQRGYDQLIHDVALQNLPVTFAIDRAGMVGSDGATHQGSFDLSFMRCIPNMVLMAPADEDECRQMLYTATTVKGPAAVRYPRGTGPGTPLVQQMTALPIGGAEIRRQGRSGLALIAVGSMVAPAQKIAERLDATLVNLRFIKPLDEDLLLKIASRPQRHRDARGECRRRRRRQRHR